MSLRNPEILLCKRHAEANKISDPFDHPSFREVTVYSEAVAAQVTPSVLVKVEGMEGTPIVVIVAVGITASCQREMPGI